MSSGDEENRDVGAAYQRTAAALAAGVTDDATDPVLAILARGTSDHPAKALLSPKQQALLAAAAGYAYFWTASCLFAIYIHHNTYTHT